MHAVPLVSVPIGRAAVRDLFEQRIDLSSARQRDRVQQVRGCVPVCGGLVQTRSPPFLQNVPQCAPCPEQMATDGRNATEGHFRDLGVG